MRPVYVFGFFLIVAVIFFTARYQNFNLDKCLDKVEAFENSTEKVSLDKERIVMDKNAEQVVQFIITNVGAMNEDECYDRDRLQKFEVEHVIYSMANIEMKGDISLDYKDKYTVVEGYPVAVPVKINSGNSMRGWYTVIFDFKRNDKMYEKKEVKIEIK